MYEIYSTGLFQEISLFNENNGSEFIHHNDYRIVGLIKDYDHVIPMHMQSGDRLSSG